MWSVPLPQITVLSHAISPFTPDHGVFLCDQSPVLQMAVLSHVISYWSQITVYSYVILRFTPGYSVFSCFKVGVLQIPVYSYLIGSCAPDYSVFSRELSLFSGLQCTIIIIGPWSPDCGAFLCDRSRLLDYSVFLCDQSPVLQLTVYPHVFSPCTSDPTICFRLHFLSFSPCVFLKIRVNSLPACVLLLSALFSR